MTIGEDFDPTLTAAQAGAEWAVAVLYRDLNPALLRFLRAQEPRAADDIAGEVWLAVAERMASFRGGEQGWRAWVFTIARRRLIEHRRRAVRRRTDPVDTAAMADLAGAGDTEAMGVAAAATQEAVDALMAALPPDQAEIVLLRVIADLSVEEVARIVGRRPGTIRVMQHRALRRLSRELSAEGVTP